MPKKINKEEYKKRFDLLSNGEYELLSDYNGALNKIKVLHKKCNNIYYPIAREFIKGKRCPYCACNIKYTTEYVAKKIHDETKGEYELVSKYNGANIKIQVKHNKCGSVFDTYFRFLVNRGCRCPKCVREDQNRKKAHKSEDIKKIIFDMCDGEYEYIDGEYVNNKSSLTLKHNKCGKCFITTFTNFQSGNRCPHCTQSKNERYISDFLLKNNIKFEAQKQFNNCKNKNKLRFDFYIEDLNLCLEYDGEFHCLNIFGNELLETQKHNDEIKNKYCYQNNIKLIRIPYWNKDEIPIILNELKNEYQAAQKGVIKSVSTENVSDDINSNKEEQNGETK